MDSSQLSPDAPCTTGPVLVCQALGANGRILQLVESPQSFVRLKVITRILILLANHLTSSSEKNITYYWCEHNMRFRTILFVRDLTSLRKSELSDTKVFMCCAVLPPCALFSFASSARPSLATTQVVRSEQRQRGRRIPIQVDRIITPIPHMSWLRDQINTYMHKKETAACV